MRTLLILTLSSLLLAACSFGVQNEGDPMVVEEASSSSTEPIITKNVTYSGIVDEKNGAERYGTHVLRLADGQRIFISSSDPGLSLQSYLGKTVEARGSVQALSDTLSLLRVEELTILESESSSISSSVSSGCGGVAGIACEDGFECVDDLSDDCSGTGTMTDCMGICVPVVKADSQVTMSSSVASSVPSSPSSSAISKASSSLALQKSSSAPLEVAVPASTSSSSRPNASVMAKQNYGSALWTQKYCTTHIGFCIPVHKNWYFKSFGATTSSLWRVEFGMSAIENIGDGPIALELHSGSSEAAGAVSGGAKVQGDAVIGFADFKDSHFVLTGDASLEGAIRYMLGQISAYTPTE